MDLHNRHVSSPLPVKERHWIPPKRLLQVALMGHAASQQLYKNMGIGWGPCRIFKRFFFKFAKRYDGPFWSVPERTSTRVQWGIHCMQKLHQATVDSMLKGHRIFVCPKYLCIWISLFALNISTLLFSCLLVIFFASTKSIDALNTELTCNWKCLRPAQYIELTSIYRININI